MNKTENPFSLQDDEYKNYIHFFQGTLRNPNKEPELGA